MPIVLKTFAGEVPRASPRLLPDMAAQVALNCYLERGTLAPIRKEVLEHDFVTPVGSFTRYNGSWVGFTAASVDAVPGPIASDRLYFTGDGSPQLRTGGIDRPLALPAPATAPTVVAGTSPSGNDPAATKTTTVFVYTCVTDLDEESAPSPLTTAVDLESAQSVTLGSLSESAAAIRGINRYRIYRSFTSTSGQTRLHFVKEVASTQTSAVLAGETAGEVIPSADFTVPPATMAGIITMPNGMMAAFDGRELLFAEPYMPHTWPDKYRLKTDYKIVGIAAFGTNLAVLTEGMPYRAQGTTPGSMVLNRVEEMMPCLAAKGIVDLGYAAAYPSSDGLITVTANSAKNATRALFTKDQWRDLNPSTFIASFYDGRYVFSYIPKSGGNRRLGFIDLTGQDPTFIKSDLIADDMMFDVSSGDLFVLMGGAAVYRWHDPAGNADTYEWKSKVFTMQNPVNLGVLRVEGTASGASPAFTAEVYADGVLRRTITDLNKTHRMPGGFLAEQWEVRITGNATIDSIVLAETMAALGQVAA